MGNDSDRSDTHTHTSEVTNHRTNFRAQSPFVVSISKVVVCEFVWSFSRAGSKAGGNLVLRSHTGGRDQRIWGLR